MEKIKLKDIIKNLQGLNEEDYNVYLEIKPDVERLENCNGEGWETIKYTYTIILESETITRKYRNNLGKIEYIDEEE